MARASQTERAQALAWREKFKKDLPYEPTAAQAWREICRAGLEEIALSLLWAYGDPQQRQLRRRKAEARQQASLAKAVLRAQRVSSDQQYEDMLHRWQEYSEEDAPIRLRSLTPPSPKGPEFFKRRAQEKLPALRARTGSDDPAAYQARALKFLSSGRRLLKPYVYLYMLRLCAAGRNVKLGTKRLAALTVCADPRRPADPGTIARYFRWLARNLPSLGRSLVRLDPQLSPPSRH